MRPLPTPDPPFHGEILPDVRPEPAAKQSRIPRPWRGPWHKGERVHCSPAASPGFPGRGDVPGTEGRGFSDLQLLPPNSLPRARPGHPEPSLPLTVTVHSRTFQNPSPAFQIHPQPMFSLALAVGKRRKARIPRPQRRGAANCCGNGQSHLHNEAWKGCLAHVFFRRFIFPFI